MTLPHRYIENQFVRLSRGTLNGLPLLMPGKNDKLCNQIREIFLRDAARFNISILALNVEPFGYTAIIFDPDMRRSDLLKSVNQCISMKVKKSTTHRESLWSNRKPENVPILDLKSLENEIYNVCITPIKRGYVKELSEWILPQIGPSDWAEDEAAENANCRKERKTTDSETGELANFSLPTLTLTGGPSLVNCGIERAKIIELRSMLRTRISAFQDAEIRRRKASNTIVLGKKACRLKGSFVKRSVQNWNEYSPSKRVAICASEPHLRDVLRCLRDFYDAYRKALTVFIETKIPAFPCGVLKMRTMFRLTSAPIPDVDPFHFKT